jgi:tRNA(fMet)-specific endonuclease VapC
MKHKYMLDTNTSSFIIKDTYANLRHKLLHIPLEHLCISSITEAELLFGIAKKPEAKRLKIIVQEFILRLDVLAWDSKAAMHYAELRRDIERKGKPLGNMDLLIAAHALSINATLISNDRAFTKIKAGLKVADWT